MQHGLTREVFLGELASNSMSFLRGETNELDYHFASVEEITEFWKERWLLPRSNLKLGISEFDSEGLRISKEIGLESDPTIFS
jgi:hypothetical protein